MVGVFRAKTVPKPLVSNLSISKIRDAGDAEWSTYSMICVSFNQLKFIENSYGKQMRIRRSLHACQTVQYEISNFLLRNFIKKIFFLYEISSIRGIKYLTPRTHYYNSIPKLK